MSRPVASSVAAKLALRTSRFGAGSAAAAPRGRMGEAEAFATVAFAAAAGVRRLDTGPDYGVMPGEAEGVLGRVLPANPPFALTVKTGALAAGGLDGVERAARASLARLGVERAQALVVRDAADLLGPDGRALWRRLQALQAAGLFAQIGVCARFGDDPIGLARRFKPDLMQLPASLLDQRLVTSGALAGLAERGVAVHLRSIFQEGLIFLPRDRLPAALADAGPRLSRIRRAIAEAGADPLSASLAFALGRPEASAVLVSVASCAELRAVVAAAGVAPLALDWSGLALEQPAALDRVSSEPRSFAA